MGSNRKLLFGVLLVVAAVVFWGLFRIANNLKVAATPTPVPQAVLVKDQNRGRLIAKATKDIPQGSIVTKDMYEMVPLPGGGLATGFVTDPVTQADGFITSTRIPKGAQIRPAEDFVGHITETGIAAALRPGTRAMMVAIANKPTLHDLVRIGNYIDVNAAFDGQESRTIVQGVRVLAVDVFASDYPVVNAGMRGGYKAEPAGSAPAPGAPGEPSATPTPTAAPSQPPSRPDPALTLEVTPEQANSILLAQAKGATIDFVVLPSAPGGTSEPLPVPGPDGLTDTSTTNIRKVSVTSAQLAPYAESKKNANANAQAKNDPTGVKKFMEQVGTAITKAPSRPVQDFTNPIYPTPAPITPVIPDTNNGTTNVASPTYDIPIYADGKTVRVETVRRPQDQ